MYHPAFIKKEEWITHNIFKVNFESNLDKAKQKPASFKSSSAVLIFPPFFSPSNFVSSTCVKPEYLREVCPPIYTIYDNLRKFSTGYLTIKELCIPFDAHKWLVTQIANA